MLAKRIIPCLDVKDGRTVKGINFVGLRDAGDPVEMGKAYSEQMADELVYLDITASAEGRKTFTEMVRKVAAELSIPFTVGGGVSGAFAGSRSRQSSCKLCGITLPFFNRRYCKALRFANMRIGYRR